MRRNLLFYLSLLFVIPYMLLPVSHNYILSPTLQVLHLTVLAGALLLWGIARIHGGWAWYPSAADGALILWGVAIVASSLANMDNFQRARPILWFIAALLVGWYVLTDALANRQISRGRIIDAMIAISTFMLVTSVYQITDPRSVNDGLFGLPRLSGITGNPNLLAGMVLPVFALGMGRFFTARGFWRLFMGVYVVMSGVGILLTYSRGAWLAALAGALMMGILLGIERGWHTRAGRQKAWAAAQTWQRGLVVAAVLVGVVGVAGFSVVMYRSFSNFGRGAETRTDLWAAGLDGFAHSPIVGNGVFSTAKFILKHTSSPPLISQPHAHNLPIQVLSDLGLVGAASLLFTLYLVIRWGIRALRGADPHQRYLISGGMAATVAVGVHCLFDLAVWTPHIALASVIGVLVMTAPTAPVPYPQGRGRLAAAACGLLALLVVGTGYYSYTQNERYHVLMAQAYAPETRLAAIAGMGDLIAQDPRQPVYYWTRGMMQAVEAYENGDTAQVTASIESFNQALAFGMENAGLHLNLAALYAQLGDAANTEAHLLRAVELAPRSMELITSAARAAEDWGMEDTARKLWEIFVETTEYSLEYVSLMPVISESAIAPALMPPLTTVEYIAMSLMLEGDYEAMFALQDAHPEWTSSSRYLLRAVALHSLGRDSEVQAEIDEAYRRQTNHDEVNASIFVQSRIAGIETPTMPILEQAPETTLRVIAYLHFMKSTFPRLIVPQMNYEWRSPSIAILREALMR